jgi:hypothetical protein
LVIATSLQRKAQLMTAKVAANTLHRKETMTVELYHTAPDDEAFNDIKQNAIKIWKTYDNEFGYVDGKLKIIEPLTNIKDNYMLIVSMFDNINQDKLLAMVSETTKQRIKEALA